MEDIQSWWELPSIAHFCSLFRAAFDLLDFDIEELEEAILTDGFDRSGSPLLIELLVRLLQGCLPGRNVTPSNVDSYLRKLFRQKCQEDPTRENLFVQGEFRSLELRKKVEVLHALCDFRLEADDVLDLLKNLETESLRVEPLGYDDSGATYWYFYGTRLYREDNSIFHPLRRRPREKEKDKEEKRKKKRKKKSHREIRDSGVDSEEDEEEEAPPVWQVQCYTEDDWRNLSNQFEGSDSRLERSLLQTLKDDFLPEIPRLFEEKEKIQQKRMMEFAPRRTSGRVQKMKEKKEEEEKRIAEELEEQEKKRIEEEKFQEEEDEEEEEVEIINSLAHSPENDEEEEEIEIEEEEERPSRIKEIIEEELEVVPEDEEERERKKEDKRSNDKMGKLKGRKRRRKIELLYDKKLERWQDREEEVLHERNKVSQENCLHIDDVSRRNFKEKKPHHRKHHKRSHHNPKNNHSLVESLPHDNQVASDTSNKENSCLIDALSDDVENVDDDLKKPQVYSGRKTNNSLSSLAFSLSPATAVPEPPTQIVTSPPNKRRVKRSHMLFQTEDDLRTGMYKVLEHLRDHEDAWPFLDPVDETFAPNYYAVIRRPTYITKMESRLDSGFYSNLCMFEADFKLMMDNCKLYNGPESEYTHMAYTLEKVFAKLKTKYLETEFSSDEEIYIDMSFQQSVKRKNRKRKSTDEKENNEEVGEEKKKKRGRQKKKVGRKPKIKTPEVVEEKKRGRGRIKKDEKEKRGRGRAKREDKEERGRSKDKHKNKKESTSLPEESDFKDNEIENENESKGEDEKRMEEEEDEDDDDEDDYEEPLLLVREDPYPEDDEDDEEDKLNDRLSPPVSDDEGEEQLNVDEPFSPCHKKPEASFSPSHKKVFKGDYGPPSPPKWKKEPDKEDNIDVENDLEKVAEEEDKTKKRRKGKERRESRGEKKKKKKEENVVREEERGSLSPPLAPSDSDSDHDGGVLLYYNNMEDEGEEEVEKVERKDLSERHCELFGEIDDIEEDQKEEEEVIREEKEIDKKRHHLNYSSKHEKKRKGSSAKDRKKHHKHGTDKHHHHHHHRSKSKHHHQSKHHHHKRKTKHISGQESPGKKVLKVEEVYEYSEEDPSSKEQEVFLAPPPLTPVKEEEPLEIVQEECVSPKPSKAESIKKKKNRRKGKHDKKKHLKRKEAKEKGKEIKQEKLTKKISKRKSIKKIIKKKRKRIPIKKMAAIDALSAATEQTLKDITSLLDDPSVPRFAGESPEASLSSPSHRVASEEYESFALTIEAEYRRKLKMDSSSEQKSPHKKKKRKAEEVNEEEPVLKKKKVKKEIKDTKENDKKPKDNKENEKKVEKEKSGVDSLDNTKELFKDIKDGRIKPGAIIKSKDIAKKEGMVKKETKTSSEGKPKTKQNPFGKINKQENSKLTTLIAKAKESRIGLVPNSEVGASNKLSLGSIILFGDIGSGKHSSREPNSPAMPADEEDKTSEKYLSDKQEKWDSPCWGDRQCDSKDEASNPPSQLTEEEEEEEKVEEIEEVTPPAEEIVPPPTPRASGGQEFKQERATPNLSAWFRAFGGPKLTAAPRKKMDDGEDYEEDEVEDEDKLEESSTDVREEESNVKEEEEEEEKEYKKSENENEEEEIKVHSPEGFVNENPIPSPRPSINISPEPPVSPQPPLSPEKPPETPWFDKLGEKEEEPIWRKNKTEEEDDPYKFEEEELDRAREEAKKLEVERQRKASVSSSGFSDPSPLNIDSDRSPAAFSSEGERSPLTRSPATTKSPVTPGFGTAKQFSPVTEKSPNVPAYSPRFDTGLGKVYAGFEDKNKYQANGTLKVGFYQDMTDKTTIGGDKADSVKCLDQKIKESPIYSPTVPYVSPLYSNKDSSICKQKSPGRYGSYYSSIDSSTLDKPKTPGYYSTSAPSTPTDRPSPVSGGIPSSVNSEDKPKSQYSYYNYDPTKSLTDQYKNTGSSASKPFFISDVPSKSIDRSPITNSGDLSSGTTLNSPVSMPMVSKAPPTNVIEKPDPQPPKKRVHQQSQIHQNISSDSVMSSWVDKRAEVDRLSAATPLRSPFSPHALPANLANLSHIVSRLPEPEAEPTDKESLRLGHDHNHSQSLLAAKAVQPTHMFDSPQEVLSQASPSLVPDLHHQSSRAIDPVHPSASDLSHQPTHLLSSKAPVPPAAHQKTSIDGDRPGSRNMPPPPSGEKPHGYLHQKTMWSSSLPSSIPSSLSSLVSNATMASFALAGQKSLGSFSSEHFAQFGMDRAALASLASRSPQTSGQLFSHDLISRNSSSQGSVNPPSMPSPSGLSLQPHLNGTSVTSGSGNGSSGHGHHNRSSSAASGGGTSGSASSGSSSIGAGGTSSNNFDLGLARSYASIMSASQTSPLFVRSDAPLPGSLPRSLSGSPSPFLPQSPGLGTALGMPGSSRTPTPAHQQSLGQSNFPSLSRDPRDPRDPISQSHPSLQIPSLNSITCSQSQSLSHLNSASLAYTSRDSLALMSQGGRGSLVGVDPTHQQLYQRLYQRHQLQEELLLRSAGAHSQLAHQSMMIQQGLMSAAAASYPSGYPHTLGLGSGTYQGMNRPWI